MPQIRREQQGCLRWTPPAAVGLRSGEPWIRQGPAPRRSPTPNADRADGRRVAVTDQAEIRNIDQQAPASDTQRDARATGDDKGKAKGKGRGKKGKGKGKKR